ATGSRAAGGGGGRPAGTDAAEPEPEPAPEPEPEPRQTAEADPDPEAKPAPPRPVRKPQVRLADKEEEKPEPREDRLSSILKNVERDLKTQTAETPPEKERPEPKQSKPKVTASKVSQKMSASQLEAIRRQIERCWNPPVGARDAEDLVVELRVQLRRDGSVQQARILSTERMGDPFYRSAAESALRAVRICSPLENLPPEKYDAWRDMRLTFNPREMLGG
ncbi:energy transducer TonB family protein, partial [Ferruginivarius sediminum]